MAGLHAERQLILLSAGTASRRWRMRERAWRLTDDLDWSKLAETLTRRRLMPVLGPRIVELAEGRADQGFATRAEQAIEAARRRGAFLLLAGGHVTSALSDAGIRSTPLKGPLMGEIIYGDHGMRLSTDIDLLVDPGQLNAAVEVVRTLGYAAPADHVERCGLPRLHFALVHDKRQLPPVELHWRIHWYERIFAQERLLPPARVPMGDWRPAPADELAALLLFYARDGFTDLRIATDLGAWWDTFGGSLIPGALDELISEYPALSRALRVAIRVAENIVGLPGGQVLRDMPRSGLRDRMAERLANPNPQASPSQLHANIGFIDGLLTPAGGFLAFVRRNILLPRDVFEKYVHKKPEWRPKSPLTYCFRILARYGLSAIYSVRGFEKLREV